MAKRKPNPKIYQKVIDHFQVQPQDALVFEESVVGVEAAYRAHIPCIMISDLITASNKQKKETFATVSSLYDVINFID